MMILDVIQCHLHDLCLILNLFTTGCHNSVLLHITYVTMHSDTRVILIILIC